MKKNILLISVAILFFCVINGSRAETCGYDRWSQTDCRGGIPKNDNDEYICGTGCTFTIVGDTLKVKANSANATIDYGIFSPIYYSGGKVINSAGQEINFNKIELDGDFAYIGNCAFNNSGATITSKSGVLNVKDIGYKVFSADINYNTIVGSDVYISSNAAADAQSFQVARINGDLVFADGVTTINDWFMAYTRINGDVIIPDSVTNIKEGNFITLLDTLGEGHKVYCSAGNCYELFYNSCLKNTNALEVCLDKLNQLEQKGQLSSYPEGCTKLGVGLECSTCANNNFKLSDGVCRRVRYTPAEAAEVAGETNTIFLYYK